MRESYLRKIKEDKEKRKEREVKTKKRKEREGMDNRLGWVNSFLWDLQNDVCVCVCGYVLFRREPKTQTDMDLIWSHG